MALRKADYEDDNVDYVFGEAFESNVDLVKRKQIRRMLDAQLERKRLKQELEDYEGELDEFEWDDE